MTGVIRGCETQAGGDLEALLETVLASWFLAIVSLPVILFVVRRTCFGTPSDTAHISSCPVETKESHDSVGDYLSFDPQSLEFGRWTLRFPTSTEKSYAKHNQKRITHTAKRFCFPLLALTCLPLMTGLSRPDVKIIGPILSSAIVLECLPLIILFFKPTLPSRVAQACIMTAAIQNSLSALLFQVTRVAGGPVLNDAWMYVFSQIALLTGVFPWKVAVPGALGNLLIAGVGWASFGEFCLSSACCNEKSGVSFQTFILVVAATVLLLNSAYEVEKEHRTSYRTSLKLKQVVAAVGVMDLERASDILDSSHPLCPTECQVKEVIRSLWKYKAYLPQAMFERDAVNTNSINSLAHSIQKPVLDTYFDQRRCSVLTVRLPQQLPHLCTGQLLHKQVELDQDFLEVVLDVARKYQGLEYSFGGGQAVIVWNGHRPDPQHEKSACLCALELMQRLEDVPDISTIQIGVAAEQVVVGFTGTSARKTQVVSGNAMEWAKHILSLNTRLETSILISEGIYVAVQDLIEAYPVDVIKPLQEAEESVLVYELTGLASQNGVSKDLDERSLMYKAGFAALCHGKYQEAQVQFIRYLRFHSDAGRQWQEVCRATCDLPRRCDQAFRMLRVCSFGLKQAQLGEAYSRPYGWFIKEDGELSNDVTDTLYIKALYDSPDWRNSGQNSIHSSPSASVSLGVAGGSSMSLSGRRMRYDSPSSSLQRESTLLVNGTSIRLRVFPSRQDSQLSPIGTTDGLAKGWSLSRRRSSMSPIPVREVRDDAGKLLAQIEKHAERRRTQMSESQRSIASSQGQITRAASLLVPQNGDSDSVEMTSLADISLQDAENESFGELEREGSHNESLTLQRLNSGQNFRFKDYGNSYWTMGDAKLGQGGFGEVHMGMSDSGLPVAIKKIRVGDGQVDCKNLISEITVLSQLSKHHNIVAYLGASLIREPAYGLSVMVIMEYAACGSLADLLKKFGHFSMSQTRKYSRDILKGLAYLHKHKIMHRDVKPANVLLDKNGSCKLADFGTAEAYAELSSESTRGMVSGTPRYMAPEMARGEVTFAADVWAFGVTVLQLLKGIQAVIGNLQDLTNEIQVLYSMATLTEAPTIQDDIPEAPRQLISSCLQLEPKDRPKVDELLSSAFFI